MAKNNTLFQRLVIGLIASLAMICLFSVQTAGAAGSEQPYRYQATSMATPTPAVTPQPTDSTTGNTGGDGTSSSNGGDTIITQLWNIVVQFANDTIGSGINYALWSLSREASLALGPEVDKGVNISIHRMTTIGINDQSTFVLGGEGVSTTEAVSPWWDTLYGAWSGVMVVSSFLLPVTLLATVIFALRGGMSSFTARADAKQALSDWLFSVAFAGASYFLLFQGFRASAAFTGYINQNFLTEVKLEGGGVVSLLTMFASTGLVMILLKCLNALFILLPVGAVILIFLGFFFIIGIVTIFLAFALAALAKDVIIFIVVAVAPLVCILSAVPQFRWIFSAWFKVACGAIAIVPLTSMLWRIAGFMVVSTLNKTSPLEVWDCFYSILLWVGFASIIVGIYGFVGKLVYAAAIEVAQKAAKATSDTVGLAVKAAGLTTGASLAGLSSASASSSSTGGGDTASANSPDSGGGGRTASSLNSAPSALASFMKSSGLPLISDFGAGLESGFRMGQKPASNLSSKPSAFSPHPADKPFPGQEEAIQKLKADGLNEDVVRGKINGMANSLHAAEGIGLSANQVSSAFGHKGLQETFESAGRSATGVPVAGPNAPIRSTKDSKLLAYQSANQVVYGKTGSLDSPLYADALKTIYNASTLGGSSHSRIVERAFAKEYDVNLQKKVPVHKDLNSWWESEENILRERGLS
jgi:hypothetical protein